MFTSRVSPYFCIALLAAVCIWLCGGDKLFAVVDSQANPAKADWWYAEGVLVVNFIPATAKSGFRLGKQGVKTGLSKVDALFDRYQVKSFEKMFPGAETPRSPNEIDLSNYYRLTFGAGKSLEEAVGDFRALPEIEHVERVSVQPVHVTPNDPSFASQWGLNQGNDHDIDASEAWDTETGDSAILVGAMDTGVQWNHPDLAGSSPYINGNIWINWAEYNGLVGVDDDGNGYTDDIRGWDWVDDVSGWTGEDATTPDNDPMDFNGHGTHVAGIMAAMTNNGIGAAGIAGGWYPSQNGCRIVPLRIGWSQNVGGQERGYVRMDFAAQAFYYATQIGVTAVNCSWGSSNDGGIAAAVTNAVNHGMVVVSSAGNDNNQVASYLCSRSDVLAVASLTSSGTKSSFSNYGGWVDVSAPGSSVYSTYSYHGSPGYAYLSGTSMASPFVTGLAGLLRARLAALTKNALDTLIVTTTDDIYPQNQAYEGLLGTGRINANTALSQVFAGQIAADLRFGPAPLAVDFFGSSAGEVTTWLWHFGDGDSAYGQNVAHQYTLPGRYDVSLYVNGPSGENTTTMTSFINAYADTIKMQDFLGLSSDPLVYEVRLRNYAPITSVKMPVTYGGNMDIVLDSISTVGTRGAAFEVVRLMSSSWALRLFTIQLIANNGGGSPPLPAGDGVLFRCHFRHRTSPPIPGYNVVDTTRYSSYFFSVNTSFGEYSPAVLGGSISIGGMRGDANQDNTIDVSDVVFLISYIFAGGPAPSLVGGDADSSGDIDVSDAVYLVAYIFSGGPPPL